ncbi:uncharacterized protein LOC119588112 [Penaeus monodon]|uniref:uncharacterized protein LOC119588112 n=1 Tax=Penaeus monodon TaxID=6687 RepID=UPI0018A7B39D|nr:uncharacterized protein LOC119588112 [Penaeus monodon]
MFPLDAEGSLAIVVTPCETPLVWTISLRSHAPFYSASESEFRSASLFADASNRTIRKDGDPKLLEDERRSNAPRWLQDPTRDTPMEVPILREERRTEDDRGMSAAVRGYGIERGSYKEVVLKEYEGHEAVVFQEATAMIGLYVIQIRAEGGPTYVHVQASTKGNPTPPTVRVKVASTPAIEGVTLTWANRNPGGGYCLVLSEGRPYPSLCAARAAHLPSRHKMRDHAHAPTLLLGCTDQPRYWLPSRPARALHVAVWAGGSGGPPLGRGLVRGARRRRVPRLRKGRLLALVPSAGGRAAARYRVRRGGRRLHIMAVACGGQLRLQVESEGGRRLTSAVGGQGALHLSLTPPAPGTLTLALRTVPPGASHTLLLAAAPSVRRLPLPHMPRNSRVRVAGVGCSWASLRWSAARASASYCILMEKETSGKPWRARAPLQTKTKVRLQLARVASREPLLRRDAPAQERARPPPGQPGAGHPHCHVSMSDLNIALFSSMYAGTCIDHILALYSSCVLDILV